MKAVQNIIPEKNQAPTSARKKFDKGSWVAMLHVVQRNWTIPGSKEAGRMQLNIWLPWARHTGS